MKELVSAVRDRCCILFGGAGLSRDADIPGWYGLADRLLKALLDSGAVPDPYPASIAAAIGAPDTFKVGLDLLLRVVKRQDTMTALRAILSTDKASKVHQSIRALNLPGFITTNYDRLLNGILGRSAWVFSNSVDHLKLFNAAVNTPSHQFLLKLHGDLDNVLPPNDPKVVDGAAFIVLSDVDYAVFRATRLDYLRLALHAALQSHSILFVGYGLGDPHINDTLEFLAAHCSFARPSWFVTLKGDAGPRLPENVELLQPISDWPDLADWLVELARAASAARSVPPPLPATTKPPPPTATEAVQLVAEYLHTLETDNLVERALSAILVPRLLGRDACNLDWLTSEIAIVLEIGPIWARTFASAVAGHLCDLGLLRGDKDAQRFFVIKRRVERVTRSASVEFQEDREAFLEAVRRRLAASGKVTDELLTTSDNVVQHLCMSFGRRMAEWMVRGIGREIGLAHIQELATAHFRDLDDIRRVAELLSLIFENTADAEVAYIHRLLSSSFLLNAVKIDPTAGTFLKTSLAEYKLYLDSNVLLPFLVKEHENHGWMRRLLEDSQAAGTKLYVTRDILNEVHGHRHLAEEIARSWQYDEEALSVWAQQRGYRANFFIQGHLTVPEKDRPTIRKYLAHYTEGRLEKSIEESGIEVSEARFSDEDAPLLADLQRAIADEWSEKFRRSGLKSHLASGARPGILNRNEARQFVHLYRERRERAARGQSEDVWFLSFETVLERVYLREPQTWGRPPTFPVSAWAGFLDARLFDQPKNRRDILTAIVRGNSTAYSLPDAVVLVRRRAFGSRVLSKTEVDSVKTALSNAVFFTRLEKARTAVNRRGARDPSLARDFAEIEDEAVAKVNRELRERVDSLQRQLERKDELSRNEEARLRDEIAALKKGAPRGQRRAR